MPSAGKSAALYSAGYDLSAHFRSGSISGEAGVEDGTTWGDNSHEYVPTLLDHAASFSGFFDGTATTGLDALLAAALGGNDAPIMAWLPNGGATAGDRGYGIVADVTSYEVNDEVDGLIEVSAEVQGNGWFPVLVITPKATFTATDTGAARDGLAANTTGGSGFLQVFSVSAGDTIDAVIQDSADGSTGWTTICTFAQVTAGNVSGQRVAITGTIRRYTRAVLTLGGAGISIVAAVQLHRAP